MIAHFDIDAFYASVAVRDNPSLAGKPVAVAGDHRRSVVLTASYEARPFGVRSAIPLYRALELCPHLVVVPPTMALYKQISQEVFAIFRGRGRAVEGLSLDEAFIDLGRCSLDEATALAQRIRDEVRAATKLTISGGVASGKMLAKIASDACKPDGLLAIAPGSEARFLAPLPVGRLWGVGPKSQARLEAAGIATIGDVAALDATAARVHFGSWGSQVCELARGIDARPVVEDRETKSISSEETFEFDVRDERRLIEVLRAQALEVAEKLGREDCSARTVGVKIKRADFQTYGRQTHLAEPTRDARRILKAAIYCLRRAALDGAAVRLIGLRVASLVPGESLQTSFL